MSKIGLSIVIPMYNAESWIIPTVQHILSALEKSNFKAEIIIIDDGSTDSSVQEVKSVIAPRGIMLNLIEQENKGRYLARKVGVTSSMYDNILFIDSRVYASEDSLMYLSEQLKGNQDQIWNGHVNIDKKGNIFARFWDAIVCIAWRRYFKNPRTTSYGINEFDYYPKGTGFFYVPKNRLQAAMDDFESKTNDIKFSSDDTLLIRYMTERQDIHLSPNFSCLYNNRSTFKGFLKHAYNRGQFFVDGFLRPGTRFFYPLILVLLGSLLALVAVIVDPSLLIIVLAGAGLFVPVLFFGAIILGIRAADAFALAILGIPFAVVYGAGLWRGVLRVPGRYWGK